MQLGIKFEKIVNDGKLVPAEVVMSLVSAELETRESVNWMLDGFPRSLEQAKLLDAAHPVDFVVNIDVPFEVIMERLTARWCHVESGRIYNLDYNPRKVAGLDDDTGEPLVQRPDDTAEALVKRLAEYHAQTKPLVEHYTPTGVVSLIDGDSCPPSPAPESNTHKHIYTHTHTASI